MPLPKPRKGENQSDFMGRCMHEAYGASAPSDRTQEQAVAMCMSAWRAEHGGSPPPKNLEEQIASVISRWKEKFGEDPSYSIIALMTKQGDGEIPEPEDGETKDDFMTRCVDEVGDEDAEEACELAWEEFQEDTAEKRAASLVHKTHSGVVAGMEFVLSDETPDRLGDVIISEGWDFANFAKNPVALFNHRADFIVGKWHNIRVHEKSLRGDLEMAPKGTSDRIDEIRNLIDADILRAVSVGFKPIKSRPIKEDQEPGPFGLTDGGRLYSKCELVEVSLVSIPANPNALAVAKALRVSPETQELIFAEHGSKKVKKSAPDTTARTRAEHGSDRAKADTTGEHAAAHRAARGGQFMLLGKRIEDAERYVVALQEKLQKHLESVDDQNPDDASMAITEELTEKIASAERNRDNLKAAEARLAKSSGDGSSNGGGVAIVSKTNSGYGPRPFNIQPKKIDPLTFLFRQGVIQMLAHKDRKPIDVMRQELYGNDEATKVFVDYATKAASAPALTSVAGWAQELVQQIYADFMQALVPTSVMASLSTQGLALTFGRAGKIIIPTRNLTPSLAGSFVGEGAPIPVRQGAFAAQTLTPKKMAVITTWTREMDEHSSPAIEGLLREAVQIDTSTALDTVLLDANPATAIRPPGLRNGVAGQTPTAGGGFAALVGDIKNLSGALLTATQGHIRKMVFLMNPQQVLSISLIQPPNAATGLFPFADDIQAGRLRGSLVIQSGNVPLGTVIALDAADFVSVGSEAPRFEVSDQATLHMEDTAPADITGGTPSPAVPVKSMWQTDSMALRLVWPMNWALRRPNMVQWVAGVTW